MYDCYIKPKLKPLLLICPGTRHTHTFVNVRVRIWDRISTVVNRFGKGVSDARVARDVPHISKHWQMFCNHAYIKKMETAMR